MPGRAPQSYLESDGLFSPREIANLFDISLPTVIRYEREGRFGKRVKREECPGRVFFRKEDVERAYADYRPRDASYRIGMRKAEVEERTEGSLNARVFALCKQGKSFHDIVIELEAPAARVRKIMKEYEMTPAKVRQIEQQKELEASLRAQEVAKNKKLRTELYFQKRTEMELAKIEKEYKEKARVESPRTPRIQIPKFED